MTILICSAQVLGAAVLALALAWWAPRWLAHRVGRGMGVTSIAPTAPQRWRHVQTILLDPVHTLTTGDLVVTEVSPVEPDHERNLRWFAGALAHGYDDPVGRALAKLSGRGRLTDVILEPGHGVRGSVDRHPVRVGDVAWIGMRPDDGPPEVGTTVAVEVDQRPLGRITVAEEVRRDAAGCLAQLRRLGFAPVLVSAASAARVARLAELSASSAWHAPADPHQVVAEIAGAGGPVGVVRMLPGGGAALYLVDANGPWGAAEAAQRAAASSAGGVADQVAAGGTTPTGSPRSPTAPVPAAVPVPSPVHDAAPRATPAMAAEPSAAPTLGRAEAGVAGDVLFGSQPVVPAPLGGAVSAQSLTGGQVEAGGRGTATIHTDSPSIDTVVQALTLVNRQLNSRRRALVVAGALTLLALLAAALGLLAPWSAGVAGAALLVLTAAAAAGAFLGLGQPGGHPG